MSSNSPPSSQSENSRPAGSLSRAATSHAADLRHVDLQSLMVELTNRLERGDDPSASAALISLGDLLCERLSRRLEVHENRFSPKRFSDLFWVFQRQLHEPRPSFHGARVLDLGCGGVNPLGMGMLLTCLGAVRVVAVDLDTVEDAARAARGMARLADAMLQDPARIVGEYPITRDEIQRNLTGIDLARLRDGSFDACGDRLVFRNESAASLSLPPESIDFVMSNSFLEHVDAIDTVLGEIARVTKRSGFGVHSIDGLDHWHYGNRDLHPLEFLRAPAPGMLHGSNRVRPLEFPRLFEKHGLAVQQVIQRHRVPLTPAEIATFAPPWNRMSRDELEVTTITVVTRKR